MLIIIISFIQDTFKIPNSMTLPFTYEYIITSNITCEPWIYRQELRSFGLKEPLLSITVNLKMEKKYKCAPEKEKE